MCQPGVGSDRRLLTSSPCRHTVCLQLEQEPPDRGRPYLERFAGGYDIFVITDCVYTTSEDSIVSSKLSKLFLWQWSQQYLQYLRYSKNLTDDDDNDYNYTPEKNMPTYFSCSVLVK